MYTAEATPTHYDLLGKGFCYCALLLAWCSISGEEIVLQTTFHGIECVNESNYQSVQSQIENEVVQRLFHSSMDDIDTFQQIHVQTFIKATHLVTTG